MMDHIELVQSGEAYIGPFAPPEELDAAPPMSKVKANMPTLSSAFKLARKGGEEPSPFSKAKAPKAVPRFLKRTPLRAQKKFTLPQMRKTDAVASPFGNSLAAMRRVGHAKKALTNEAKLFDAEKLRTSKASPFASPMKAVESTPEKASSVAPKVHASLAKIAKAKAKAMKWTKRGLTKAIPTKAKSKVLQRSAKKGMSAKDLLKSLRGEIKDANRAEADAHKAMANADRTKAAITKLMKGSSPAYKKLLKALPTKTKKQN